MEDCLITGIMDNTFTKSFEIRLNEVDHNARVKLPVLFDLMQETAGSQSDSIGYGVFTLIKKKITWVVSRYHMQVDEYPRWKDSIKVTTWRSHEEGLFAIREYLVHNDDREYARATSSWSLIDTDTGKPVDPQEYLPEYPHLEKRALDEQFNPLPECSQPELEKKFSVRKHDCDLNRHVNNSMYVAWGMETVPVNVLEEGSCHHVEVNFRGEARFGQAVLSMSVLSNGRNDEYIHSLRNKNTGKEITRLVTRWHRNR